MVVSISFKQSWLFDGSGINSFAVKKFIKQCEKNLGKDKVRVQKSSIDSCVLEITSSLTEEAMRENLTEMIDREITHAAGPAGEDLYSLRIEGAEKKKGGPSLAEQIMSQFRRAKGGKGEQAADTQPDKGDGRPFIDAEFTEVPPEEQTPARPESRVAPEPERQSAPMSETAVTEPEESPEERAAEASGDQGTSPSPAEGGEAKTAGGSDDSDPEAALRRSLEALLSWKTGTGSPKTDEDRKTAPAAGASSTSGTSGTTSTSGKTGTSGTSDIPVDSDSSETPSASVTSSGPSQPDDEPHFKEAAVAETPKAKTDDQQAEENAAGPGGEEKKSALEKIEALVGASAFKSLCREIHARAPIIHRHHTEDVFCSGTYLFSVNTGEGFSTAVELFRDLLVEDGLIRENADIEEHALPDAGDSEIADKMRNFTGNLGNMLEGQRVIALDISSWANRTTAPEFRNMLLRVMRKNVNGCVVIFRIPSVSNRVSEQVRRDIRDVLSIRAIDFESFSEPEFHELAGRITTSYGFDVSEDAWDVFDRRVMEEKSDGYFYGVHTVKKIVNEMITLTEGAALASEDDDMRITGDLLLELCRPKMADEDMKGVELLNALVGLESVKQQVLTTINQMLMARRSATSKLPCMHMRFEGNPGTGKTTIARIIGQILKEKGVLRIGNFYEHKGRDLCGRYVGETAIKTTSICQEAYGSVLFIDEAYSLYRGNEFSNDYGREAIDTLITEMENHSDDLVVILAGYPDDMETMLRGNAGMSSRIPYCITFPNFTREELYEIFVRMVDGNFKYAEGFLEEAKAHFDALPSATLASRQFGNARYVRNLYERTWGIAAMRYPEGKLEEVELTKEDFTAAVGELGEAAPKEKRRIGF